MIYNYAELRNVLKSEEKRISSFKEVVYEIDGIPKSFFLIFNEEDKKSIKNFEIFLGKQVPQEIVNFYMHYCYLSIKWVLRNSYGLTIEGHSFTCSAKSFVNGQQQKSSLVAERGHRHEGYLWEKGDNADIIKELEDNYFIFDRIDLSASVYVIFRIFEEKIHMYLYKFPNYFYPLKLSFTEYIEKLIEFRGILCWQDYFIDREKTDKNALKFLDGERKNFFHKNMRQFFPEIDISSIPEPSINQKEYSFEIISEKKDYAKRFIKRFSELKALIEKHGGCSEFNFEYNWRDTINCLIIRKIEGILKRPLPDSMLAFYSQINGFKLDWRLDNSEKYGENPEYLPKGEFHLLGLDQIFGGFEPHNKRNWNDTDIFEGIITMKRVMNSKELEFARTCRLMSNEEFNDIAIRFVEGKKEPELYVKYSEGFFPLTINFEEYIELLLDNMGMEYWQRYFIEPSLYPEYQFEPLPPTVEFIKDVFPSADISKYRKVNVE